VTLTGRKNQPESKTRDTYANKKSSVAQKVQHSEGNKEFNIKEWIYYEWMGGVGSKDMYRHTITAKYASRQRNLPNACRTKDSLDNAGNNAATSVEIRMT